jgi:FdhD protein
MALRDAPVRRPLTDVQVLAVDDAGSRRRPDRLVTEEPMEIRVHGPEQEPMPFVVTMRTPGHDFELAAGLCFTEGIVATAGDIDTIAYCLGGEGEQLYNVVTVRLRRPVPEALRDRRYLASASCGICGKAALDEVEIRCQPVGEGPRIAGSALSALPERLAEQQRLFSETGGLHAAARVDANGVIREVREDVGRHNALDKLIGNALLAGEVPLDRDGLLVSGRMSFELVQKAAIAGLTVLCAVSAPSSLAVAAADRFGQTLVGFLRGDRFNIYTHPARIDVDS